MIRVCPLWGISLVRGGGDREVGGGGVRVGKGVMVVTVKGPDHLDRLNDSGVSRNRLVARHACLIVLSRLSAPICSRGRVPRKRRGTAGAASFRCLLCLGCPCRMARLVLYE